MGYAHSKNQDGFTLVEISIVMIIIGLLIGGTFGGRKLIENMQVNKTVQDLKAIESAALTFKDTYGRLPGDITNPASRLPSCLTAPCATGGNGNRKISETATANFRYDTVVQTASDESYTFWHHLAAADLLNMRTNNTANMIFGEGQPKAPIGGGYRIDSAPISLGASSYVRIGGEPSQTMFSPTTFSVSCRLIGAVDRKMDDGQPLPGQSPKLFTSNCFAAAPPPINAVYKTDGGGLLTYDIRGF